MINEATKQSSIETVTVIGGICTGARDGQSSKILTGLYVGLPTFYTAKCKGAAD